MQTLILGIGNELLGDEGVGVHAARLLRQEKLAKQTDIIEVGTAILDALPWLEKADRVIILDAMKGDQPAGSVYKISLDDCSGAPCIASMHGFDIFRVMALAGRSILPPVIVFGVEPEKMVWSMELSTLVSGAMPYLLDAVRTELMA